MLPVCEADELPVSEAEPVAVAVGAVLEVPVCDPVTTAEGEPLNDGVAVGVGI